MQSQLATHHAAIVVVNARRFFQPSTPTRFKRIVDYVVMQPTAYHHRHVLLSPPNSSPSISSSDKNQCMQAIAPREGLRRQADREAGTLLIARRMTDHIDEGIAFNGVSTHNIVHVYRIIGQRLPHLGSFLHESWTT